MRFSPFNLLATSQSTTSTTVSTPTLTPCDSIPPTPCSPTPSARLFSPNGHPIKSLFCSRNNPITSICTTESCQHHTLSCSISSCLQCSQHQTCCSQAIFDKVSKQLIRKGLNYRQTTQEYQKYFDRMIEVIQAEKRVFQEERRKVYEKIGDLLYLDDAESYFYENIFLEDGCTKITPATANKFVRSIQNTVPQKMKSHNDKIEDKRTVHETYLKRTLDQYSTQWKEHFADLEKRRVEIDKQEEKERRKQNWKKKKESERYTNPFTCRPMWKSFGIPEKPVLSRRLEEQLQQLEREVRVESRKAAETWNNNLFKLKTQEVSKPIFEILPGEKTVFDEGGKKCLEKTPFTVSSNGNPFVCTSLPKQPVDPKPSANPFSVAPISIPPTDPQRVPSVNPFRKFIQSKSTKFCNQQTEYFDFSGDNPLFDKIVSNNPLPQSPNIIEVVDGEFFFNFIEKGEGDAYVTSEGINWRQRVFETYFWVREAGGKLEVRRDEERGELVVKFEGKEGRKKLRENCYVYLEIWRKKNVGVFVVKAEEKEREKSKGKQNRVENKK